MGWWPVSHCCSDPGQEGLMPACHHASDLPRPPLLTCLACPFPGTLLLPSLGPSIVPCMKKVKLCQAVACMTLENLGGATAGACGSSALPAMPTDLITLPTPDRWVAWVVYAACCCLACVLPRPVITMPGGCSACCAAWCLYSVAVCAALAPCCVTCCVV